MDSHWLFRDDKEKLTWMVIDIIEELMGPGHGPQTGVSVVDSKDEVERTLKVGCKEKVGICHSFRCSIFWRIAFAELGWV